MAEKEAGGGGSFVDVWVSRDFSNGQNFINGNWCRDGARIHDRRPGLAAPNFLAVWVIGWRRGKVEHG
jgi:hypothetical protein